jgi:hypothetical protein
VLGRLTSPTGADWFYRLTRCCWKSNFASTDGTNSLHISATFRLFVVRWLSLSIRITGTYKMHMNPTKKRGNRGLKCSCFLRPLLLWRSFPSPRGRLLSRLKWSGKSATLNARPRCMRSPKHRVQRCFVRAAANLIGQHLLLGR